MSDMAKSRSRVLHWGVAILVMISLASGHAVTFLDQPDINLLRLHLGFGGLAGLFSVLRLVLWFQSGPPPGVFSAQSQMLRSTTKAVHGLLRLTPIVLLASGIGMLVVSGAAHRIFAGTAPDPQMLANVPPRNLHHLAAAILLFLIAGHSGAALWHWLAGHSLKSRLTVK